MQPSHILRFKIAKTDHFILQQQSKAIITRSHTINFYHFLKNMLLDKLSSILINCNEFQLVLSTKKMSTSTSSRHNFRLAK